MAAIEIVLFDLGGVLIELGGMKEMASFSGEDSEDELWRRWLSCPWVRRFERGLCHSEAFAEGMIESWSMNVSPDEFLKAFAGWPRGLLPGAREMVLSVDRQFRVGCLSNTNPLHAERQWRDFGIADLFTERFFSHEMGVLKPDRDAFEFVVEALDCAPNQIFFLDDNQINVDGAIAAGLRAERACGPEQASAILAKNGLCGA